MAEITPVKFDDHATKCKIWLWETVTSGDTCAPVKMPYLDDATIYSFGTFSGAASVALHGSPQVENPTLFVALTSNSLAIAHTAAAASVVDQNATYYKPVVSAGDGSTDLDIYIVIK